MADNNSNHRKVDPATRSDSNNDVAADGAVEAPVAAKDKPSGVAAILAKLGLEPTVLILQFKGSLPPIIGIAMYQSDAVSKQFATLGYLIPIISVLGLAILPRGKFLQNMVLNVFAICLGGAVAMLALWSAVQARIHTTPAGQSPIDPATKSIRYNSSQSAVCGVWLFFGIWFVNMCRAKFPSFNVPVILFSILINVASTFGTRMPTVVYARNFVQQLLTAMLTGMALATVVSLFVIPISSRMVVTKEFQGAIGLMRKIVGLQSKYLVGLEELDMFTVATRQAKDEAEEERERSKRRHKKGKKGEKDGKTETPLSREEATAKELREVVAQCRELMGKIQMDITFAKREVAWGKLSARELGELAKLIRNTTIPIVGMTSIMDIFQRVAERRGWNTTAADPEVVAEKNLEKTVWNEVMKRMHEPFQLLSEAIDEGLQHAALQLEITPRPKAAKKSGKDADVEARGDTLQPGDVGFTKVVDEKLEKFRALKGVALRAWVKERALLRGEITEVSEEELRERDQAQLYVLLYMERLMYASAQGMKDLVNFSDMQVADGTMSKNRLIFPSQRRLRKWFLSIFDGDKSASEDSPDMIETGANIVYVGDGYNRKKDPEHLPPANAWERFGNGLRKFSRFFGSQESVFGFRVACATMTIGIIALLEHTQVFFVEQRLVWAMIMVAIGMTMTSGQSIFGFFCRVGGTLMAMIFCYIIWYIVDEKTPGVIVFLWFSIFCDFYLLVKFPRFIQACMIMMVTQVMIIGYELQVRKVGVMAATATGQPYYATYKLAPYRVATVAGGCFVAFIWTIFPSPMTDRTWLRRDLSATLYLLANYFSVINSTMQSQFDDTGGNPNVRGTPASHLQSIRRKIFGKVMLLLPSMRQHADWQKWEPTIGGKFPRATYEDIIKRSTRIMSYLTYMSYTMNHPLEHHEHGAPDTGKKAVVTIQPNRVNFWTSNNPPPSMLRLPTKLPRQIRTLTALGSTPFAMYSKKYPPPTTTSFRHSPYSRTPFSRGNPSHPSSLFPDLMR